MSAPTPLTQSLADGDVEQFVLQGANVVTMHPSEDDVPVPQVMLVLIGIAPNVPARHKHYAAAISPELASQIGQGLVDGAAALEDYTPAETASGIVTATPAQARRVAEQAQAAEQLREP